MIKIENVVTPSSEQWKSIIMGARNPMNSWARSDSSKCTYSCDDCDNFSVCNPNDEAYFKRFWEEAPYNTDYAIGPNDHTLMMNLAHGGPVHAKYRRMITVYVDITAPLYWWKEFDTYKVGTVANSCSTMHKIHAKEFELSDFSHEHLADCELTAVTGYVDGMTPMMVLSATINMLNYYRKCYLEDGHRKDDWWQMIQLLPSSYNQKRTVMLNYEVLAAMYESRKNHKLDCWREFCKWIESLPYSELIIGEQKCEKNGEN